MNTSQFEAKPDKVDHWTPESHWCGDCWSWVVDCAHMVDPLPFKHYSVEDVWIRSLAYDRVYVDARKKAGKSCSEIPPDFSTK